MSDVTRILSAIEAGDPHAAEQLWPLVYTELRRGGRITGFDRGQDASDVGHDAKHTARMLALQHASGEWR